MERGRQNKRVVWVPHMWVKKIDREFLIVRSPVDSASRKFFMETFYPFDH